jgi:hypothetical protein
MEISLPKKVITVLGFVSGFLGLLTGGILLFVYKSNIRHIYLFLFSITIGSINFLIGKESQSKDNVNTFSRFFGAIGMLTGLACICFIVYLLISASSVIGI